jgi:murein DD-endopeptidase MepM/ murein hydrolase activator NlpD
MNYHFYSHVHRKNKTNNSMLFATDIVKTGSNKNRFLPRHNQDYPVFAEKVFCPMQGEVIKVEKYIEDNVPFSGNYPYNTGNTVVIKNCNYFFLLGHLKKESIVVSMGDTLRAGDLIGQIGNSGYSERPHLHMQLIENHSDNYWFGKGISIRFRDKNLYKNRVIHID